MRFAVVEACMLVVSEGVASVGVAFTEVVGFTAVAAVTANATR
jgi:hypothetical protein